MNKRSSSNAAGAEQRLRQQLVQARSEIADLQEELQEKNNLYLSTIKERDAGAEQLQNAKESLNRFEALVKQQVDRAQEKERKQFADTKKKLETSEKTVKMKQEEIESYKKKITELNAKIFNLQRDNNNQYGSLETDAEKKLREFQQMMNKKDRETMELQKHINYLQDTIEDFMAENKVLREMASVPANFGIDREKVKLTDREKIDDFKKLIRVLQEDNYRLEAERAKLKHMLKQQSMMYSSKNPDSKYQHLNLTPDQVSRVDEFVWKLVNGEANEPSDFYEIRAENEKLKAQMEALNDKSIGFLQAQLTELFNEKMPKQGSGGLSDDQFQKLQNQYGDMKGMIDQLILKLQTNQPMVINVDETSTTNIVHPSGRGGYYNRGGGGNNSMQQTSRTMTQNFSHHLPQYMDPENKINPDNSVSQGISHKFDQSQLEVTGKNGETVGLGTMDHENAFLQLQLQESFELIFRKDESLKQQKREIELLYNRIKKYLLMQDHLYKDFVKMENDHAKQVDSLKVAASSAEAELALEKTKTDKLQKLCDTLDKGAPTSARLIELTKQNSLLEVNLIRMTRKYQALEEQEKLLRRNYQNVEKEMTDLQVSCMQRINSLKEWKRNATFQLKQLYEQLRVAVPYADHESVTKDNELLKKKNGDYMVRNTEYADKINLLQSELTKLSDSVRQQRELQESKNDLDREFQQLRSRLENIDPSYRQMNQVYYKMVQKLKQHKVSIISAFEQFDENGDGQLDRNEFFKALDYMGLGDLTNQEFETVLGGLDKDGDSKVSYKEFNRKLQGCGYKQMSRQEELIMHIINKLQKLKMTKSELFNFINKDGEGLITRKDFKDIITTLEMSHVSKDDIESFCDYFYQDQKGGIDLKSFLGIFERYEKKFEFEAQGNSSKQRPKRAKNSPKLIEMKKKLFEQVDFAMKKYNTSLKELFRKVDSDNSMFIGQNEFSEMLRAMQVHASPEEQIQIFKSIDYDQSGQVNWAEFKMDFDKCVNKSLAQLEEEERLLFLDTDDVYATQNGPAKTIYSNSNMNEFENQRRIASLEDKVKQAYLELQNEIKLREHSDKQLKEYISHHNALRKQFNDNREEYFNLAKECKIKDEILKQSIKKDEAEKLQKRIQETQQEIVQTRAALLSYKSMHNTVCEQVKQLKIMHERRKDENESLIQTLRDIQSESIDKTKYGKLYYVVMLSRWQEAAVNKKYDMKIEELKILEGDLLDANQLLENKEREYHLSEVEIHKIKQQLNNVKQELSSSKNMFLTVEQGAEFTRVIDDLTDERSKLEELYYKVRSECVSALNMLDDAQIKAFEKDKLYQEVKRMGDIELSGKLVEMSDSIQQLRLNERKANRKALELEERENYLSKILSNRTEEVSELEQNLARMEKDFHIKEEQWRLRDNERQRQYINKHFASQQQDTSNNLSNSSILKRPQTAAQSFRGGVDPNPALQSEIERLRGENQKLTELVAHKESIISKINDWGATDQYVIGGEEHMKDMIEEQRIKFQSAHSQESKEMADAAYQTIKTLNEMLEQKKLQLKSKEDQIDKLRQQMADQREKAAHEYMKLQSEVTAAGKSTLANLHSMIKNQDEPVRVAPVVNHAEMQKLNAEMDHLKKMLIDTQEDNDQLRQQRNAETESRRSLQEHCDKVVKDLEEQVRAERLKREKKAEQRTKKNEELIAKFQQQMIDYESEIMKLKDNNETTRLKNMARAEADSKSKEEVSGLLNKDQRTIADLNEKLKKTQAELKKAQELEKKTRIERDSIQKQKETYEKNSSGEILKLRSDKDNAMDQLRESRLETEKMRTLKEKFQADWDKLVKEKQGAGSGMSYSDMAKKIKDLEKDIYILEAQKRVVIAHNPSTNTFEYIGEPMPLDAQEVTRIEEIIKKIKEWLERPNNERLSVKQVFESMDIENFGEVSVKNFESALMRIGVKIKPTEMQVIKSCLDTKMIGFLSYRDFVRELQGVPQLAFMHKGITKLANIAVNRNLSQNQFLSLIDQKNLGNMTIMEFQDNIKQCKAPDFIMEEEEVSSIFKQITKAQNRNVGVKMNITHLIAEVYDAVRAIIIDKVRDAFEKVPMTIYQLFSQYDKNGDGYLEYPEMNRAILESKLKLESEMSKILITILDPASPQKKQGSGKISHGMVKYYLESFGPMGIKVAPKEVRDSKQLDSMAPVKSEEALAALTQEQIQICKKAARKILLQCHNNIIETVGKLDTLDEGIVNKENLKKAIMDLKVSDLELDELNTLCKLCDKQSKGYISTNKFIDQLYNMANESESDVILRRLCKTLSHQDLNLEKIMKGYDTKGTGVIDKPTFKKCLKQLSVAMSDNDILKVVTEIAPSQHDSIDVKHFCNSVTEAGKVKPLPNYISQGPKGSNSIGGRGVGKNPMQAYDAEKKYKKNLEALKQEIEEKTREGDGLRLEVKGCHDKYNRLDFEKKQLEARLVDKHSKPPKETQNESDSFAQKQELMQLKEQLFAQQEENTKLRKTIEVQFKAEISRLSTEKDQLNDRLGESNDEKQNLRNQINRLLAQPLDGIQKREELELSRQLRIDELETQNKDLQQQNADVNQQLFKAEEKLLDLKFEKETYDLQYARLQKRIQVLEQFKLSSAQVSAEIAAHQEEDQGEISIIAGRATASSKSRGKDSVKVKMSSGKNTSDLEVVVESLKRVVDKLKTENEALKRENGKIQGQTGKIISEKALRQKINNLEQLVQSYEMKEINLDEREKTIKKLIEANKQLREDMCRESDRYLILEDKYKQILLKNNMLQRDNKKNEDLVFGMTTGGNMKRYSDFLGDNE